METGSLQEPMAGGNVNLGGQDRTAQPGFGGGGASGSSASGGASDAYHRNDAAGAGAQGFAQDAGGRVAQEMATQAVSAAARGTASVIRAGASEIRVYIEKNHYSVEVLSLCGGIALAILSFLSLFNITGIITGPFAYITSIYEVIFGVIICIIDGPTDKIPNARNLVLQQMPFLFTNVGRGAFYLFIASLEAAQGFQAAPVHFLLGLYFMFIAGMFVMIKCSKKGQPQDDAREARDVQVPA